MKLTLVITLLTILCFVVSCDDNKSSGKKMYWHSENGTPTQLDPVESSDFYQNMIVTNVYDTLYSYKYLKRSPYELKPNLAEGMPKISENGLVYTIKIKEGVLFSDDLCFKNDKNKEGKGREVIAEDFVFSLKRHFDPQNNSRGRWLWRDRIVGLDAWKTENEKKIKKKEIKKTDYSTVIDGLKTIDKYTLQVTLTKQYPQIMYTFAMGFAAIVPKEAIVHYENLANHAVGSGPFIMTSFTSSKVVLEKNPTYRKEILDIHYEGYDEKKHAFLDLEKLHNKKLPIVDKVKVSFITEEVARWNSFTKGNEIQYAVIPKALLNKVLESRNPPTLKPEHAKKYILEAVPEQGVVFIFFNMEDATIGYSDDPVKDKMNKALRKAIRKSFNWKLRIDAFYSKIGKPFAGIIPPSSAGYSKLPTDSVDNNIEEAKKILKEAGWTTETLPTLEYANTAGTQNKQLYEQFRDFLLKIDYPKEKIKQKLFATFGDFSKAMKDKKNMMNPYAWGLDYPDAENTMQLFYGPNASPGSNSSNFNHPEYNKLFEKAKIMPHCKERTALYKKMSNILIEECVGVFGFSRTFLKVWHKDAAVYPTRDIISNYFKYVDVK